jgi:hypothetical protein
VKVKVCSKCREPLTDGNANPSILRKGSGCCRPCDSIRKKEQYSYRGYRYSYGAYKKWAKSANARHWWVKRKLRSEGVPESDLLWKLNFYTELISDGVCHYCGGTLSAGGHSLDRKENHEGHRCFNVVPCCARCNSIKSDYFSYSEMQLLSPVLRKIRETRR